MIDKYFKKRILGLLVLTVLSEYRNEREYKHFIRLYFLLEKPILRFFSLTYRTGRHNDDLGHYSYFDSFYDKAMTIK